MSSLSNTTSVKQNVSGWLKKKSSKKIVGFAKLWQKFFFILDREDQSLKYWKSSDTTRPPVGDIHLSFVKTVSMVDKGKADAEKRFVLNFRGSHVRAFDLKADSIADLNMWILSIRSVQTSVEDKREVASDGKFWKPKLPKKQSNGLQSESLEKASEAESLENAANTAKEEKKIMRKDFTSQMNKHMEDASQLIPTEGAQEIRRPSITDLMVGKQPRPTPEKARKKEKRVTKRSTKELLRFESMNSFGYGREESKTERQYVKHHDFSIDDALRSNSVSSPPFPRATPPVSSSNTLEEIFSGLGVSDVHTRDKNSSFDSQYANPLGSGFVARRTAHSKRISGVLDFTISYSGRGTSGYSQHRGSFSASQSTPYQGTYQAESSISGVPRRGSVSISHNNHSRLPLGKLTEEPVESYIDHDIESF